MEKHNDTVKRNPSYRIYLSGKGLEKYRPFLKACLRLSDIGKIPKREDKNGKRFIFVNDLLKLKDKPIKDEEGNIIIESLDLSAFFAEGVVAFNEVKKLSIRISKDADAYNKLSNEGKKRITSNYPNLGDIWLHNKDAINPFLKDVGLGLWAKEEVIE